MALGKIAVPEMDPLDPLLAKRGHAQAKESFNALVEVLGGRQAAIFCSPPRRAIGTALMAGTVATNDSVSWALPKVTERKDSKDDSIPITVLNALGDFASRVYDSGIVGGALFWCRLDPFGALIWLQTMEHIQARLLKV